MSSKRRQRRHFRSTNTLHLPWVEKYIPRYDGTLVTIKFEFEIAKLPLLRTRRAQFIYKGGNGRL